MARSSGSDARADDSADEGDDLPQLPLLEEAEYDAHVEIKPTWRGWLHAGTFPVAVAAGIVLIVLAQGAPAKWASAVFMATSMLLLPK